MSRSSLSHFPVAVAARWQNIFLTRTALRFAVEKESVLNLIV
jgi:hypothetical protein